MMTTSMMNDKMEKFDVKDVHNINSRWKKWKRSFEIYAAANNIVDNDRKKNLMLHSAGINFQDLYFALPGSVDTPRAGLNEYVAMIEILDEHFNLTVNVPYERQLFRRASQEANESLDQYIIRLRQLAASCEYTVVDDEIRDQIMEKVFSVELKKRFYEKANITLKEICEIGKAFDQMKLQISSLDKLEKEDVNKIAVRRNENNSSCFRCGYFGHSKGDSRCPAIDKKCNKCGYVGHFASKCFRQNSSDVSSAGGSSNRYSGPRVNNRNNDKRNQIKQVVEEDTDVEEGTVRHLKSAPHQNDYVFAIRGNDKFSSDLVFTVGGVEIEMLVDSGSSVNVVDENTWNELKRNQVKVLQQSKYSDKVLNPYGGGKSLVVIGVFKAEMSIGQNTVVDNIYVIQGKGSSIVGRSTATQLEVLKIGVGINAVNASKIGKLNDVQVNIYYDDKIQPKYQQFRRIPYPLQQKVESALEDLQNNDIIEEADGRTTWVSPLVVVPKQNGSIRLCVDMREVNKAIIRERFMLPTIEDVLLEVRKAKFFSKLDISNAFHQIELTPESRMLTTFSTHKGLYRFKRLMFGITCAPEIFQRIMSNLIKDCDGCMNFIDDIIVYGDTLEEHDKRLEHVMNVIKLSGMTLNDQKCEFRKDRIQFMGFILSQKGVEITDDKVGAIKSFREPTTSEEVRSFLGLVTYVGRFIPDLSTKTEPLRNLLRKNCKFQWGELEKTSFEKLKLSLIHGQCLGFYDPDDITQVIADASPYGLGCVLVQINKQGKSRVISYGAKGLSDAEKKYSQIEKEALSLVWAVDRFYMYLYGRKFELLTDHKPLEFIFGSRSKPHARIDRWIIRLSRFDYKVVYIPGKDNIADSLSRLCEQTGQSFDEEADDDIFQLMELSKPIALTLDEIRRESVKDDMFQRIRRDFDKPTWCKELQKYEAFKHEMMFYDDIFLRGTRIVIPASLRERVLQLAHEGHPGIDVMKRRVREKIWWPSIDKSVENYVKKCHGCLMVSLPNKPEPLKIREHPSSCFEEVALDLLGPLPDGRSILVVVDWYSKFKLVEFLTKTTTKDIIRVIMQMFLRFGFPAKITSDNGPQFYKSQEFIDFCRMYNIFHHKTTPYSPQANGEVERQNRSILKRLKIAYSENKNLKEELDEYLYMYTATPHSTTGRSPAEMMFGRKFNEKIPTIFRNQHKEDDSIKDKDFEQKIKRKIYHDQKQNAKPSNIEVGDQVLMKRLSGNKLATAFLPTPLTVLKKHDNVVQAERDDGKIVTRNSTHFKRVENEPIDDSADESVNEYEEDPELLLDNTNNDESFQDAISSSPKVCTQEDGTEGRSKSGRIIRRPKHLQDFV